MINWMRSNSIARTFLGSIAVAVAAFTLLMAQSPSHEDWKAENPVFSRTGRLTNVDLSLASDEIRIVNECNQSVKFNLRPLDGDWSVFELESNYYATYSNADHILIITKTSDNRQLRTEYKLPQTCRYKIVWNEGDGKFEVYQDQYLTE